MKLTLRCQHYEGQFGEAVKDTDAGVRLPSFHCLPDVSWTSLLTSLSLSSLTYKMV